MIALVVPSNREDQILEFLQAWQPQLKEAGVRTYVVEDYAEKTFKIKEDDYYHLRHLCWQSAPPQMDQCIHLKSPGCRGIGFWQAYRDQCEVIVTLDDDVRPAEGPNLFKEFYRILTDGLPVWVDPLLNYRSRGYPEENTGFISTAFHVGSFLGVPDVDGTTQLEHEKDFLNQPPLYIPRPVMLPAGQLIPVNGGICGWRRELTPYIHYTLWHQDLSYRRFDDIWMGVILKRFLDLTGMRMSYGGLFVRHIRASDAHKNARYEIEGKKWNEFFWQQFDREVSKIETTELRGYDEVYSALCGCLSRIDNDWARAEGQAMALWRGLF